MSRIGLRAVGFCASVALVVACGHRRGVERAEAREPEPASDESDRDLPGVIEFTAPLQMHSGLLNLWVDPATARVYAQLDAREPFECLYVEGLAVGLGANPAGLDRGEIGPARVARFAIVGDRVHVQLLNDRFRASSGDDAEARATRDAFPTSVIWAGPVVARNVADSTVVVDLTEFVVRDAHGVARHLADRDEGDWSFDRERSGLAPRAVAAFVDNIELEAQVTFGATEPGTWSGSTPPRDDTLTLRQHHSLVRLPDDGFEPRVWSARMGHISHDHLDFSAPLHAPLTRSHIIRHRLSPDAPLVYYVDRGTPEPLRSALIEGASWWTEAFEAAGFPDGFRVELLPEDADPMDVRYNLIHWVHRSTRGWSYGSSVVDPRTGEIVRGNVTLGSQRVRQDRRIFEALIGARDSGKGGANDPVQLALARVRQLAAHEVGHTLGFEHNFAASTYGRASVMDYPAPWIHVRGTGDQATLDLSEAYGVGLGAWDRIAFEYAYREWDDAAAQHAGLAALLERAESEGLVHLSDAHTHAFGAAHPDANVWDNGSDSIAALLEVMAVRAIGLRDFGPERLAAGAPPEALELTFAPLYFLHRYQIAATAKLIGGQRHAVGPDVRAPIVAVDDGRQRAALDALLDTVAPEALVVPSNVMALMRPTPYPHIDGLPSYAGPVFDPDALAAAAASMTLEALLERHRAHRLELMAGQDPTRLGYAELLDAVHDRLFARRAAKTESQRRVAQLVREVYLDQLVAVAADDGASTRVRGLAEAAVRRIADTGRSGGSARTRAAALAVAERAQRWLDRPRPADTPPSIAPSPPPGSPIGQARACGGAFEPWSPDSRRP